MRKYHLLLLFAILLSSFVMARSPKLSSFEAQAFAFRKNKGQIRDQQGRPRQDIDFVLQTPQMTLYIGNGQLHYQFVQKTPNSTLPAKHFQVAPESIQISRIDVEL